MADSSAADSRRDRHESEKHGDQNHKRRRSQSPDRRDDRRDDRRSDYRDDRRDERRDGRDRYRDDRGDDRRDDRRDDRDDRQPKRRLQSYASRRNDDGHDRSDYDRRANDELPQAFDARTLEPAKKRARSRSPVASGSGAAGPSSNNSGGGGGGGADLPRKPKRPGQRARITDAEREAIRQRALERERHIREEEEREREQKRAAISDVVRSHYNAVPERGREWRKTASTIKGLRSMNNWIKSCIIQKFAPDEEFEERTRNGIGGAGGHELLVLDIGCGKGGDLGKWNQAPQRVQLYVGLDPADVSIRQARDRYREMTSRGGGGGRGGRGGFHNRAPQQVFDARFFVKDCFGESIGDINIIQDVGFDQNPLSRKGFDVVSMMFCMHYAFESEEKARIMLKNVASALKKGGRLIGCIPNSDVLGERVERFHIQQAEKTAKEAASGGDKTDGQADEKTDNAETTETTEMTEMTEKNEKTEAAEDGEVKADPPKETAEWGNSIYRVRFPGDTPADGVFRPPFGWKYNFFLNEAVEEVPEYVVPWHAFRALAEDYNLELQYHKTFTEVWESEKDDRTLGPLSERMGVRDRNTGELLVSKEEMEAAAFYVAFCFYKV